MYPLWKLLSNLMYANNCKSNLLDAAYEGGFRLQRRFRNVHTSFTYGRKLNYKEIDDPTLEATI